MHASPARLSAGILQPTRAADGRCLHCSLPAGRGCRCALPHDDRRRPDLEGAPAFDRWPAMGLAARAFA